MTVLQAADEQAESVTGRRHPVPVVLHLLVAVWAVVAAIWRIGRPDWLVDELLYVQVGRAHLAGDLSANREHPPLARYLFGLGDLLVGGRVGPRLVAAAAGLVTCLALYLLARRVAGWRWGLVAALAWSSLPHTVPTSGYDVARLERYTMLDVVAGAIVVLAVLAGVRWRDDPEVRWAALTGLAVGAATASKLSGALVGPVLVVAVLLAHPRRQVLVQGAVAAASAVLVYALAHLPYGTQAVRAALEPVTLQLAHAEGGHSVLVAGQVYERAPWWSALHYGWRDDGPWLNVAVAVLAVLAVGWSRDRRLPVLLAACVVVPFAVLATSPVALPHYRYLWLPALLLLAVLGLRAGWSRGPALRAVAVAGGAVLVVASLQQAAGLGRVGPDDYALAACVAEVSGARTAAVRGYGTVLAAEAPELAQVASLPADLLVLDPRITNRFPADDDVAAARAGGYEALDVGALQVWVAPGMTGGDAAGGCADG